MANKTSEKNQSSQEQAQESWLKESTIDTISGIALFLGALVTLLAFFGLAGIAGNKLNQIFDYLLGWGKFLVPTILALLAFLFFSAKISQAKKTTLFGFLLFVLSFLGLFETSLPDVQAGGLLGKLVAAPFLMLFDKSVTFLILFGILIIGILIAFNLNLMSLKEIVKVPKEEKSQEDQELLPETPSPSVNHSKENQTDKEFREPPFFKKVLDIFSVPEAQKLKVKTLKSETPALKKNFSKKKTRLVSKLFIDYPPPPLTLLDDVSLRPSSGDISGNKNIIKRTLADFGIAVEMGEVNVGPTVTQYTLKPASGINLSRIVALRKNLSLALAADPIRIEAPIPGKSLVGIEIPNKSAAQVRLRGLLKRMFDEGYSSPLTLPLGRDVSGEPVFADLTKMPHLLIAGATGSGKSICINNIILSLLYLNSPKTLRLILIDPKRVEMTPYNGASLLLTPVIVEPKEAINALRWAVREMENRYKILSEAGFRDITSFNENIIKDGSQDIMPYIVIIIDELADLMASYKKEVEAVVVRLAQMARAVGIHLIASTQRPSTDVVTGLIKANITTRIAFKVASQIDSRTILDQAGAEKLLGAGDMLYMSGDATGLKRIQGTYVSETEIKRVVAYLAGVTTPEYRLDIIQDSAGAAEQAEALSGSFEDDDILYEEVKDFVIQTQKASASLLQRRFRLGYARAARLLDMLEAEGIIGPQEGAKPRKVLVSSQQDQPQY